MGDEIDMRDSWNRLSAHYQEDHQIPTDFAHYGPHCPNEDDLNLVGDVRGKRVLEIGCGGGQCSIAFAKRGAVTTGLDLSDEQIKHARHLAEREGVDATFLRHDIENLSPVMDGSQDVVFSAYALQYVRQIARCLTEVRRVLVPGGLLVFSVDHPFWTCLAGESLEVVRSYHDRAPLEWDWGRGGIQPPPRMRSYHRTVGDWLGLLRDAGLDVLDILEPAPVERETDQSWGAYYAAERQRMVPATIIWKAREPEPGSAPG